MTGRAKSPTRSPLELARELLAALEALGPFAAETSGARGGDDAVLLLETKVIPELEHGLSLPVFVGVQGGTNTGKSTVFNALAGKLLSPSTAVASATKHPLIYLHSRWKETFLAPEVFAGLECRELTDPKELLADAETTNVLYFRLHDDARLEHLALIDSPDHDSALVSNAAQAARIAAVSDLTLFVTTAQKYRDRVLVAELTRLLELKSRVILLFNLIEEDIVFETILDDLASVLPPAPSTTREHRELEGVCLPASSSRHPEEDLRATLAERVLDQLHPVNGRAVKPTVVRRTARRVLDLTGALLARWRLEKAVKQEILEEAGRLSRRAGDKYAKGSDLAFPEETLAIRKVLRLTELGAFLALDTKVERGDTALAFVGSVLRKVNDTARRLLVRVSGCDEGCIDVSREGLAEYAATRDARDAEAVLAFAEAIRVGVESFVRRKEGSSLLARRLMRSFFTPELATTFSERVRRRHEQDLAATGETGAEWLPAVDDWLRSHRWKARSLSVAALAFKAGAGILLAWALPPDKGLLGVLSPVKWLTFAAGYFLAAYVVSLLICTFMRRRPRFERARRAAAEQTVEAVLLAPLRGAAEAVVNDTSLHRVEALASEAREHPELSELSELSEPPEAMDAAGAAGATEPGPSPPC